VLIANTHDDHIALRTAYQNCDKPVKHLLGHFKPCGSAPDEPDAASADAVFGFAFGYRMRQWAKGVSPTDRDQVAVNRIPGANNAVLAEQARQLHLNSHLDLYLQFEIADAIAPGAPVEYRSQPGDQGTTAVLKEFMSHAASKEKAIRAAVLVAHRHHFDRCRLLLEGEGVRAIRPPDLYTGYDPLEAQPRVMSPEECIVNDFASMAGMARSAEPGTAADRAGGR
jgi:hypothetical protein